MNPDFNEQVGKAYQAETMKRVCLGLKEVCLLLAKGIQKYLRNEVSDAKY